MEVDQIVFLAGAGITHALVGYALVNGFTDADPRLGILFGLLPDVDFWFPATWGWPFVHRGITHTPLFAITIVAAAYVTRRDRTVALAVLLAIGSHVAIDSLSPRGIDWLFPLETTWSPGIAVHGLAVTISLWTVSIGILAWQTDDRPRFQ